jgi:thiol-disulfide isomerase/thioredoxin
MKKIQFLSLVTMLTALTLGLHAEGNKGYDIKINIKSLANTKMILAFYYGDKQYVKDTAFFDKNGVCTLKADTVLPGGIYLAVFPTLNNKYFEFIISEPRFSITTDTSDLAGKLEVKGSVENEVFYKDMHFLTLKRKESEMYSAQLKAAKDEKEKEAAKDKLKKLDEEVKAERLDIINKNPNLLYSKVILGMKPVDVGDPPKDAVGRLIDSNWAWRSYKRQYWNSFDLKDDRLIRTPIFHGKLKEYYGRTLIQIPDSLIVEGDLLLRKMNPKSEIFKYTLVYMLNEMANSKVMGFDAVYVHLVKEYYSKGYATWVDSTQLYKINERGRILDPLLLGRKAKNIALADTTLKNIHSLYDIPNKYTVLCFWDPDCSHCKKEIPKLAEVYHKLKAQKIDVAVYAPSIMSIEEMKKWTDFIKANNLDWINVADPYHQNNFRFDWDIQSTPQIYILDKDKNIKAKRIGADQVEDFIRHEIDPSYRPKNNTIMENEQNQVEPH